MNTLLTSFWRRRAGRAGVFKRRPRRPPQAEPLEQRIAPAAFTWINPAGGAWETNTNWSFVGSDADGVPDSNDDVTIDPAATVTVTVSTAGQAAHTLSVPGDDTLQVSSGSLTLGDVSSITNLSLLGGSLVANGQLDLTGATTFAGSATFTGLIHNTGTVTITTGDPNLNNVTFTNDGTIIDQNARLDFESGGKLVNASGGLFEITATGGNGTYLNNVGGTGFDNHGIFRLSGAATVGIGGVPFNNLGGHIDVTAGTLQIGSSGTWTDGNLTASNGTTLDISGGTKTLTGTLTGSGMGAVTFSSGTLGAGTGGSVLNFPSALFRWSGSGTLSGVDGFTNNGAITITTNDPNLNTTTLTNHGTIIDQNARLDFESGGKLVNASDGLFEITTTGGGGTFLNNTGGAVGFDNAGIFRLSGNQDVSIDSTPFNNLGGHVDVTAGTLHLGSSGMWHDGDLTVSSGATLDLSGGTKTLTGTITGSGAGAATFVSGTLAAGTGGSTLNFPAGLFRWSGSGTLNGAEGFTNAGSITITGGDPNLNNVTLQNSGTINNVNARLDFETGGHLVNLASGVFDISGAGNGAFLSNFGTALGFDNFGTFRHSGAGGASIGSVPFNNSGGKIDVTNGTLQLDASGSYDGTTISVAAGKTLILDGGTKTISGSFAGSGAGTVSFASTTLTTGLGATLNFPAGMFNWSGSGTLTGGTFTNTGFLQLTGGDPNLNNVTLQNSGTINNVNARLDFETGGHLVNLASGVFDISGAGNGAFLSNFGTALGFDNFGTFRHSGTGGASIGSTPFNNLGGTIDVTNGTLQLDASGNYGGTTISVAAGKTLILDGGTKTISGSFAGSGAGTVSFASTTLTTGLGATLNFPAGMFNWSGSGTLTGGTFTNTGFLQLTGGDPNLNNVTLQNSGTINNVNARLDFETGGHLVNLASGVFDISGAGNGAFLSNFGTALGFDNFGTFRHSGAGGASIGNVPFNNPGTVEVVSGALQLNGPVAQIAGGTLTAGTWKVAVGATLVLPANITTNNGTIELGGIAAQFETIATNNGVLSLQGGHDLTAGALFTNNGTLVLGPGTNLTVPGSFAQGANGVIEFQLGGVPASGQFGKLIVTDGAALDGTARVSLADGYGPALGQVFTLATYGSSTGAFDRFDGVFAQRTRVFDPLVTATDIQLTVVANAADLDVTSVTSPTANGLAGQNVTINFTVTNIQTAQTFTDSWTDSIYLSLDDRYDSADRLIGRVPHTGFVAGGDSYNGSITAPLPGVVPGDYKFIVVADSQGRSPDSDRSNNTGALAGTFVTDITAIGAGIPVSGAISADQDVWYRINLPTGQTPRFLANLATAGAAEVYVRQGDTPTLATFDNYAFDPLATQQGITKFGGANGTYYVLLHGRAAAGGGTAFTFTADALDFGPVSVVNGAGANVGEVTATVRGSLFTADTIFSLVPSAGAAVPASKVIVVDSSTAWATFDLTGLAVGSYGVRAADGAAQATLANSFQVTTGIAGHFSFSINGPYAIRPPFRGVAATIEYVNDGQTDLPAQLLALLATNARYTLPGEPESTTVTSTLVLATNPDGPAGILPPGAHGTITLPYEQLVVFAHSLTNMELLQIGSTNSVMDWNAVKADLKPAGMQDDSWDAVFSNITADMGGTLASFQLELGKAATHLSVLGEHTNDVSRLMQFEVKIADDFGEIAKRSYLGAFGRGRVDTFNEHIETDSDGTVRIETGPDQRIFVPKATGGFVSAFGDTGVLAQVGGQFVLTEENGERVLFRASDGKLDRIVETDGVSIVAGYTSGKLTTLTTDEGDVTTYAYNAQGRVASVTDAVGRVTNYTYDASGEHLLTVSNATGTVTYTYVADSPGNSPKDHAIESVTYADGTQDFFTYDARGRLIETHLAGGARSGTLVHDGDGTVTATDALGHQMQLWYSSGGAVARTVDELGRIGTAKVDYAGDATTIASADGQILKIGMGAGRLPTSLTDAVGHKTKLDYGGDFNRLESITDARGQRTDFGFDTAGRLTTITHADGTAITIGYDAGGNADARIDENGQLTTSTFDAHGLLTRRDLPDGTHIDYTYDTHHNVLSATLVESAGSKTTAFEYDAADRVTKVSYPNGTFVATTYDAFGRRTAVSDQTGFTVRYTYDALGQLESVRDGANVPLVSYTYGATGKLATETRANGTKTETSYDALGRVSSIVHRAPNLSVTERFDLTYDAAGQVVAVASLGGTTTYEYDAIGQLTAVHLPGRDVTYQYDAVGNRTVVNDSGAPESFAANNVNQYTVAGAEVLAYDDAGRLVSRTGPAGATSYQYDSAGRLLGVVTPTDIFNYEYDALGNRIATIHNGVRTDYALDPFGLGSVFGEYTGGATVANYAVGFGIESRIAAGGAASFYHYDASGNTQLLTATAGTVAATYDYTPFGEKIATTGTAENPFTFNGKYGVADDGDGLYFMRARSYDPELGRFTSRDPSLEIGGDTNLYRFAANNPVAYSDPLGLVIGADGLWYSDEAYAAVQAGLRTAAQNGFLPIGETGASAGAAEITTVTLNTANTVNHGLIALGSTDAAAGAGAGQITTVTLNTANTVNHGTIAISGVGETAGGAGVAGTLGTDIAALSGGTVAGAAALSGAVGWGVGRAADNLVEAANPGLHQDFVDYLGWLSGSKDPTAEQPTNFSPAQQQALHDPDVSKYLKKISAHQPPTADEVAQAAHLRGEERRLETWDEKRFLHTLYPSTYPDPGPPPLNVYTGNAYLPGDPNNIFAPQGFGADPLLDLAQQPVRFDGFLTDAGRFDYQIVFENKPAASAPAQVVTVTQTLDSDLDLASFALESFGFGDFRVDVPAGMSSFHTRVDATAKVGVFVDVAASLDFATRILSVTFTSIDPTTGDLPLDALTGFLPPNLATPEGDAFIRYSVRPNSGLASGTSIDALATIVFDTEAPLDTPMVHNTIDTLAPTSSVTPFAAATTIRPTFRVNFTGADEVGGSGLREVNLFFTDDDGATVSDLQSFVFGQTDGAERFTGVVGHTYRFYSVASDNAGNFEAQPVLANPDATITVVAPVNSFTVDSKHPFRFTDANGDLVTVKLAGTLGTAKVTLVGDPVSQNNADIDYIVADSTTTKNNLSVTVAKKPGGDGATPIGDVTVNGSLGTFTAKQSDLVVNGFTATGTVKSITVRDVLRPDPVLADPFLQTGGTAADKLSITASNIADGTTIHTDETITAIKAADIGTGSVTAPALGKLTAQSIGADLDIAGDVGPIALVIGTDGGIWRGGSFKSITTKAGGFDADVTSVGAIAKITVKGGGLSGDLDAASFGAISVTGGDVSGKITSITPAATLGRTAALKSLSVKDGSLTGDLNVLGAVPTISVKNGGITSNLTAGNFGKVAISGGSFSGTLTALTDAVTLGRTLGLGGLAIKGGGLSADLSAASFGAISVVGGDVSGTIVSLTPAATLDRIFALKSLSITGGDLTGDVRLAGVSGALTIKSKAGVGGNLTDATFTAAKLGNVTVANNVTNSMILAGTDLGADFAPGGIGSAADTFAAGSIGVVKISGAAVGAIIGAGLRTNTDAIFGNGDDDILGGTASSIAGLTITGTATGGSDFAAGLFKGKPKIAGAVVTPVAIPGGLMLP